MGTKSGKLIRSVAVVAWMLCIIAWPRAIYNAPDRGLNHMGLPEGLYRSSLTEANFGILGFQLFESKQGEQTSNIRSAFAELRREDSYVFMKNVESVFFASATGNEVNTISQFGRSYLGSHEVDLEGNVSIRSAKGYIFEMEKMRYDGNKHEFHSDSFVQMRGPKVKAPKMYLQGEGLLAYISTERFVLKKNVSGRRRLSTEEWLLVYSRSGEFYADLQKAIFLGNAKAVLPNLEITSDVFEMSVDEEHEFLYAQGNVHLVRNEKKGLAEKVFIEVGSGRIVLEGNASIDQNGTIIEGKRIVIYTSDDRVVVEDAEGRMGH